MNYIYEQPRGSALDSFAGGEADLTSIFAAARDSMLFVDNTNSQQMALERAYDDRIAEARRLTGITLENPVRVAEAERREAQQRVGSTRAFPEIAQRAVSAFDRQLADAAARNPDQNAVQPLFRPIGTAAAQVANDAEQRMARLAGSRDGLGKWMALLAGSGLASLRDPMQIMTLAMGGGPGLGRTVASRILSVAAREAFVNGAAEAAMQPMVQAWREKAGLDHGTEVALRNIGFAALFGGVFGGVAGGASEGLARLSGRGLAAAGDAAGQMPALDQALRRTLEGDMAAAAASLPEIRPALPAAARGALDHAEILDHLDATRPPVAAVSRHDELVSVAHRAVDRDAIPRFEPDRAQAERILREILGDEAPAQPAARSLVQFLVDRGGLRDDGGELAAIGAGHLARKGRGKDRRQPLDMAREAAEEAGYLGRAGEVQVSTVRELLDAIDTELRGQPVLARADLEAAGATSDAAARAHAEATVAEIQSLAGPAVDDRLLREAAELSLLDGLDPSDALERVLVRAEQDAPAPAARTGDPLPGWSDDELEAAAALRGDRPEADGIDDPAAVDDDMLVTSAELEEFADLTIPDDDGQLVPLEAYMRDIARAEDAAHMLENCRL